VKKKRIAIDREFRALCPPLAQDELELLESNLIADGCRDPLVTWRGILIDGHNRFEICERLGIAYRSVPIKLTDRAAALQWIIVNQLGRRNLAPYARAELGMRLVPSVETQAKARQRLRTEGSVSARNLPPVHTAPAIAKRVGIGETTFEKARAIAAAAGELGAKTIAKLRRGEVTIAEVHRGLRADQKRAARAAAPRSLIANDGSALRAGDWRVVLADVDQVDAVITDPPFSAITHDGAARATRNDGSGTIGLAPSFNAWTDELVHEFVSSLAPRCRGWMVALCDDNLIAAWKAAYRAAGRLAFAAVPIVIKGGGNRLVGGGPASDAIYAMCSRPRTKAFASWSALPGHYIGSRSPESSGGRGKASWLMEALVRDYTMPGDLVCDPLAGWGSTLIAARAMGRRAIGAELDTAAAMKGRRRLELVAAASTEVAA